MDPNGSAGLGAWAPLSVATEKTKLKWSGRPMGVDAAFESGRHDPRPSHQGNVRTPGHGAADKHTRRPVRRVRGGPNQADSMARLHCPKATQGTRASGDRPALAAVSRIGYRASDLKSWRPARALIPRRTGTALQPPKHQLLDSHRRRFRHARHHWTEPALEESGPAHEKTLRDLR